MWCCAQAVFKWIEAVDSKRVKMLKGALRSAGRFWSRLTVDQADKLCFFVVIVLIQSRSFFVWENLFEANAVSICIAFIPLFVWSLLFRPEVPSFKSTFIQGSSHSCDHLYSEWWLFRVAMFILGPTRVIVGRSCSIYREYGLSELFVETDLRPPTCFGRKRSLQRTVRSTAVEVTPVSTLRVRGVIDP